MKKKLVSLVLVAAMALSMVACGNKAASTESSSTGEAPAVATTKEDKTTLNIWMSSEPAHIDPALNSSVDGGCLAVNSFEGLMRYNEAGELEPACAESYEVSDDGLTYTFTMRDGLKWSNGDDLDATDFVYSWKRAASPEVAADYSYLCEIFPSFTYEEGLGDDVVASEDGKTLTVTLGAVCPYFLDLCAFPFFFPVNQEAVEASMSDGDPVGTWANDAGENFVCNGAYVLSSWNHDSDMTYVKNDNYWDADSVTVTTLNVMLTAETTAAYTAYTTGDLDFIDDIPVEEMETAKTSSEYVVLDNLGTYYASFNYNTDLYDELGLDEEQAKVFRHAIALLIDRQYIIDTVGQNNQEVATSFVPAGCSDGNGGEFKNKDYYSTDYEANVEEAKSLLESIGLYDTASDALTQDISLTYLTNNSEGNVKIGECIQADLATVGINLSIDQEEWNVFQETRKAGKYDFAREGWIMDYNDPINMLEMYTTSSGNNNPQFGKDSSKDLDWAKYDQMISDIRSEADLAARAELMHEAEDYLMDTWCIIPIYYYNDPYMIKDYVDGVYGTVEGMKYFYHATIN
ncbi:peptide ABC transporter substrate-binding protein [Pseudobutyrivibrio sp. LB2011]|uniref:peptide ABC transporter substrate-binding protein n=1 Tax=Pseudobutyrivibrio sp. LB2011 TaxID=1408312 RepID=UPI0005D20E28|nr:peptide ABC transporter substrate-binding protein [Pseudobutyrivibrio sp. LB2011]